MRVHLDLELGGTLNLTEVGADVWSRHEHTVPILCGFAIDDGPPQGFDFLHGPLLQSAETRMLHAITGGAEIHAWNAAFERLVWNNLLAPRYGYPLLAVERFHCTMAQAANAGLPMNLDDAAIAAGAEHTKDRVGQALMKRMSRPRGFHPDGTPRWWHIEEPSRLGQLAAYNLRDVQAERDVWRLIPRMTKRERDIWLVDQHMNDRGLPVDKQLVGALADVTVEELLSLNKEIYALTNGVVSGASQGTKLLAWLQGQGYPHDSLSKDILAEFINSLEFFALPEKARRVLYLRAEASKTSTAKLRSVANFSMHDGRARHLVQYGGAVRTLRWAGRGPQIQNFPRPIIKHVDGAIREILGGMDGLGLRVLFGRPLDVVSSCLRGVFKAPENYSFVVCDFHAIEAVTLAWLAGFTELLDVFRRHEDVYVFTANAVGSADRQLGKVLRLACGYGMGAAKFQKTAKNSGLRLTPREADDAVRAFRTANLPIVDLWHAYESAARDALAFPRTSFWVGPVMFRMALPFGRLKGSLLIQKPSEGHIVYRNARFENGRITYDGVNQYTRQWQRLDTYGGKLVENVTQAVARDLLADAMLFYDKMFPGTLLTTVHDEIVSIVPSDCALGTLSVLTRIMSTEPAWAPDLPLSASGGVSNRYTKA